MSDIFDSTDIGAIKSNGAAPPKQGGIFDDDTINAIGKPVGAPAQAANTNGVSSVVQPLIAGTDAILGMPGQMIKGAEYAIRRAVGQSPQAATEGANHGVGEWLSHPLGDATGTTNTAGYEAGQHNPITDFISEHFDKGADWIAQQTGLPKADVANMMQTVSYAAPAAVSPIVRTAKSVARTAGEAAMQTAAEDMEHPAPTPTAYNQARASYNAPETSASPGYPSQYGSAGAAASNIMGRLNAATPAFREDALAHISEAQEKFGADWQSHIDWNALERQLNADSLPVPGRLTRGQATQDEALLSEEKNKRNANGLAPIFSGQNDTLIANLRAIRESSAPDVYSNTPAEHAQTLIDAYKELYAQEKGAIDAKWNNIRSASSDGMIFDAGQMLQDAQAALKSKKLTAYDPGGQLAELMDDARRGGLTADGYVNWRQNLGREAMKGGNEGAAASAILEATNKSDMLPAAKQYRDMVNDALAAGRALHAKLANDPAYKAVADGNASVKDFINKFVINNKPENVIQMRRNLVGNDVANQTLRAAVMDHLRTAASLNEQYQGNFAAASFNKNLGHVTPVARLVFDDGELQRLGLVGEYARNTAAEPKGAWINRSNTAVELNTPTHALLSKAGNLAASGLEATLAHHTGGASIPFISAWREGVKQRAALKAALEEEEQKAQFLHDATRPSAGIVR